MGDARVYDLIVIGAGPAGLEMAAAAAEAGLDLLVLERGQIAAHVEAWGFVELFSPWSRNVSKRGQRLAGRADVDGDALQTGRDFRTSYLLPLAQSAPLSKRIRCGVQVISIGRSGSYKNVLIGDPARAELPFVLLCGASDGEFSIRARAVVDASGVYGNPRSLGDGGIAAVGEAALRDRIYYELNDLQARASELAGRRLAVVGAGYSACTLLEAARTLNERGVEVWVDWISGAPHGEAPVTRIEGDPLPYRDKLAAGANMLAATAPNWFRYHGAEGIASLRETEGWIEIELASGALLKVDELHSLKGFRPDRSLYRELQFHECWATSGPMKLAAQLLGQAGAGVDCLAAPEVDADALRNPEPGFYVIGAKSYGRNSQFLMERIEAQVASVMAFLSVDLGAA